MLQCKNIYNQGDWNFHTGSYFHQLSVAEQADPEVATNGKRKYNKVSEKSLPSPSGKVIKKHKYVES